MFEFPLNTSDRCLRGGCRCWHFSNWTRRAASSQRQRKKCSWCGHAQSSHGTLLTAYEWRVKCIEERRQTITASPTATTEEETR